jgi:hypothetical protein
LFRLVGAAVVHPGFQSSYRQQRVDVLLSMQSGGVGEGTSASALLLQLGM